MLKWIIIGLALIVLYKLFTNDKEKKAGDEKKIREQKIAAGKMVKDPSCGSYVDVEGSISVKNGNEVKHFCSYECREAYIKKIQGAEKELPHLENEKN